ncbi:unnamed protein product [Cuscuta epithymum]|uniref:PNO1 second type I KH domain-containing protein n=1 Tax=Cuscuta epithymum TaxID=186058 RepID=A0AAV0DUW8_9ASTE|nr:unnamed protein product [Cuscuta epithymum]
MQSSGGSTLAVEKPIFNPLRPSEVSGGEVQFRKISVPSHRIKPLKDAWYDANNEKESIYYQAFSEMKIDIRMNLKTRKVELKTRHDTPDISHLQKCADFIHAFILGFDLKDAMALLRLDEVYVDTFEIKDVKTLRGEHMSRAIGRLCGKGGDTKFAIELLHPGLEKGSSQGHFLTCSKGHLEQGPPKLGAPIFLILVL